MGIPAARLAMAALCAAIAVSGCAPTLTMHTAPVEADSSARIVAAAAVDRPIDLDEPVSVRVEDGRLISVSVTGPDGAVPGALSPDGSTWQAERGALDYGSEYRVRTDAIDTRGVVAIGTHVLRTVEPKRLFDATMTAPSDGSTVGVGSPITVAFDRKVKDRAEVERALVVRTTTPVEGAWTWLDGRTAQFRPEEYWPGNIDVRVDLDLMGVQSSPGTYGRANRSFTFRIGPSMVTKVDATTHQAEVIRDGQVIRTIPITTGKSGFETRSGVKVIMTKERMRIMDAATTGTDPGDPEYYRLEVQYAMRVTDTGEFVHAAPWSVRSQGLANVSHGCIGMSLSNAEWLFSQSSIGDVVEITGTDREQDLGNGITVWNEPWTDWLAGSAVGARTTEPLADTAPLADAG